MTSFLRSSWRLLAVAFVIKTYYLTWWVGLAFVARDRRRRARWRARIFSSWSRSLLAVLGFRIDVVGSPPKAPFFLVSNHLSYVDVLVFAAQLHAVFVAKSDVEGWPVLGPICRSMDTIFIDRSNRRDVSRVVHEIEKALDLGDGVVLFPEGTSTSGEQVLPFLPSILAAPVNLERPVHYASISYATSATDPGADLSVCWWGGMTFPGHLWQLLGLRRVEARVTFGSRPIASGDRKELARTLHRAVVEDFTPVVGLPTE